ncbi:MAG: hypothetical protein SGJ23_07885, partial [Alphaproteobacteria bacterium]|nr:hypothetical protein [Alphaproteobacteria bacterium]
MSMLDLESAFAVTKSRTIASVVFIGVQKDANLEAAKAVIEKAGFKTDVCEDAKNGVIFKQSADPI